MDNIISKISVDDIIYTIDSGIDTSDATASERDIIFNKTAYVANTKITGIIPVLQYTEYIPSTVDQIIGAGNYLNGNQILKGDPELIPSNIITGKSIFGVKGDGGIYLYIGSNAGSCCNFPTKVGNNINNASPSSTDTSPGTRFGYTGSFGFRSSIICPFDCMITYTTTSGVYVYKNGAGVSSGSMVSLGDILGCQKSETNSIAGGHGAFIILNPI